MPTDNDAITSEFADAVGLSGLKAAGGRSASAATRSHGSGSTAAAPPAASGNWPPPPTPEPFRIAVSQLDFVCRKLVEMTTKVEIDAPEKKYMDELADQFWPVAHIYGAGAEAPTKGVLITYAMTAALGYAVVIYTQWKTKHDARLVNAPQIELAR